LLAASLTAVPTEPPLAVGVTPPIGGIPQFDARMTAFGGHFKSQVLGEEKWPGSEKFAFPQAEKLAIRPAETWPFRPAESFWAGETHPSIDDPKMPFEDFPFGSFVGENGPDPIDPLGPIMRANPFGFRGSR
jgi:hypothetical protein